MIRIYHILCIDHERTRIIGLGQSNITFSEFIQSSKTKSHEIIDCLDKKIPVIIMYSPIADFLGDLHFISHGMPKQGNSRRCYFQIRTKPLPPIILIVTDLATQQS